MKLLAQRPRAVVLKSSHLSLELIVYGQERCLNGLLILSPHDQVGDGGGTYEGGSCDVVGGIARLGLNSLAGEAHLGLSELAGLLAHPPTWVVVLCWVACEILVLIVMVPPIRITSISCCAGPGAPFEVPVSHTVKLEDVI